MKLPPFEEFMKSINLDNNVNQNNDGSGEDENQSEDMYYILFQNVSIVCLNHIECYHNWLAKQLEDNTQSTEKDIS